jgi:hypothetical protein
MLVLEIYFKKFQKMPPKKPKKKKKKENFVIFWGFFPTTFQHENYLGHVI